MPSAMTLPASMSFWASPTTTGAVCVGAVVVALPGQIENSRSGLHLLPSLLRFKERGRLYEQQQIAVVPVRPQGVKGILVRRLSHAQNVHLFLRDKKQSIFHDDTPLRTHCQYGIMDPLNKEAHHGICSQAY